jgi:transcription initiation factor TFIIIB Brf1 subunit/transcription initiation factor TFIIB
MRRRIHACETSSREGRRPSTAAFSANAIYFASNCHNMRRRIRNMRRRIH